MKLQNTMKVAEELSAVTSEIREEMLQHRGNAETAVQEREKVGFMIPSTRYWYLSRIESVPFNSYL